MSSVQRPSRSRRQALVRASVTAAAAALVLVVLVAPTRLADTAPGALLRVPVELVAYLAVVLALPARLARLRWALAGAAGVVLGLVAVFRLLDVGFLEVLNRPFDPLIDWRYAGALAETVRGSVGEPLGTVLLVLAGGLVVGLLVLLPLAVLRLTRLAVRHRGPARAAVAALAALWLALALLDVRTAGDPVASRQVAGYVHGQVARVPSQLDDRREFAEAAAADPLRGAAPADLLAALRGKDVLVVFVESLGRVALEGSTVAPGVGEVLDSGSRRLRRAGFGSRSAFLTSPTFGGLSWLAHATLQSGLWVDSQQRYDHLVTTSRLTLSRLFGQAGWRTVAVVPANNRDWPQGAFYGFDQVYDSRNLGYQGPRFGYATMPDQYTLHTFHRRELAPAERRPVMAQIDLVSSHTPWTRTPRMVPWSRVGDGSVYHRMARQLSREPDVWPSPDRVRAAYGEAVEYSLTALTSYLTEHDHSDLVVVVLGDHQPATIVAGEDAGHDVPVAVVASDPAVLDRISGWGWTEGLRPGAAAPVWRMDAFRDRFLAAYAGGDTGSLPAGAG